MKTKDTILLERAYQSIKEESNPDAKEDATLKNTFKHILTSYEVREMTDDIVRELFDAVQKHIKQTIPGQ